MKRFTLLALAASLSASPSIAQQPAPAPMPPGLTYAPIDPERLATHVRELASDAYEGRAPGSAGEQRTVDYLVGQFRALGLQPGGPDGQWVQEVPLVHTRLADTRISVSHGGTRTALEVPTDVYVSTVRQASSIAIADAPMTFVGYGVHAPERGWDDYKGVDLRGRIAVFLVNDPDFEAATGEPAAGRFAGNAMTYYGRWTYKFEEAARRGAVAALIVHDTPGAGYGWNVVQAPGGENYNVVLGPDDQQPVMMQGWLSGEASTALFRRAGLDLAALRRQARSPDFRPVDLNTTLTASARVPFDVIRSRNVLARLPGRTRPNDSVMFGAHWDAYGVGAADAQGRTIRSGAADDATGLAALIEMARLFVAGPRPQRSLVFAAWTAEERGLLGSTYYASHPVWPLATTAANFTLDTLQTAGPTRDVIRVGSGQSSLEADLERVARTRGRVVTPENHPERGLFYRADHFPMARAGVPVLLFMDLAGASDMVVGGRAAGNRWLDAFTANCYHQTCDRWTPDWDLRGAAQTVALAYDLGRELANSRRWPAWQAGSEFRAAREASASERR